MKIKKMGKNIVIVEQTEEFCCPSCCCPMQTRRHKIVTEKMLAQPFFFLEWKYCPDCYYMLMKENDKVFQGDKIHKDYKKSYPQLFA